MRTMGVRWQPCMVFGGRYVSCVAVVGHVEPQTSACVSPLGAPASWSQSKGVGPCAVMQTPTSESSCLFSVFLCSLR